MFIHMALYLLGLFLPENGKRIIFLTTLHARLVRDGVFHEETLQKLNESLHLARSDAALQLPATIYGRIWDPEVTQQIFQEIDGDYRGNSCLLFEDARRVSARIVSLAPSWIRYGTSEQMEQDAQQLFYCSPTRLA